MNREKKFDAVQMMREIRDKLSEEFMNMSFEEQKKYLTEALEKQAADGQAVLAKQHYRGCITNRRIFLAFFILLALSVAFFWGCSKDDDGDGYSDTRTFQEMWYPYKIGHQWVYGDIVNGGTKTITVIGDTILDSIYCYITLKQFSNDSVPDEYVFMQIDSHRLAKIEINDTICIFPILVFPFKGNEWQFVTSWITQVVNYPEIGDTTTCDCQFLQICEYGFSIYVPIGYFENCWRVEYRMVLRDTLVSESDTIVANCIQYFAQDIGPLDDYGDLISFRAGVDVDSLQQ